MSGEKFMGDAPVWYDACEASAWADGYNTAIRDAAETQRQFRISEDEFAVVLEALYEASTTTRHELSREAGGTRERPERVRALMERLNRYTDTTRTLNDRWADAHGENIVLGDA